MQSDGHAHQDERGDEQLRRVPDEEIPPEAAEGTGTPSDRCLHEATWSSDPACSAGEPRCDMGADGLSQAMPAAVTRAKTPTSTGMARSLPGQCAPAPSPTQNRPKLVSMIPTTVLMVFSGTSES